jgi:hypothetical protein
VCQNLTKDNIICEDNLNVAVGNVNCVIQSVNNEQIVCKPDLSFPGINQDSSDVMVGFLIKDSPHKPIITFLIFCFTQIDLVYTMNR